MGSAIALREDFNAEDLRRLARASKQASQTRRLLALALTYDGGSRSDAAHVGSVSLQIVRDWVLRFNAEGPDGLKDRKSSGRPCKLNESQRQALAQAVREGPRLEDHGVVRWRLQDLSGWICQHYGVTLSETTLSRELKKLGFVKLSARPRHAAQDLTDLDDFKKDFPNNFARSKQKQAQKPRLKSGGRMKPE